MIWMSMLLIIGKIMLLGFTMSRFEPLRMVLDLLPDNLFFNLLRLLLSCSKCIAFWSGIILGGVWIAMLASFLMVIFEKTIGSWIDEIKLSL